MKTKKANIKKSNKKLTGWEKFKAILYLIVSTIVFVTSVLLLADVLHIRYIVGDSVTGYIVDAHRQGGGRRRGTSAIIRYEVNGQEFTTRVSMSTLVWRDERIGESVQVFYDKRDPRRATVAKEIRNSIFGTVFFGVATLVSFRCVQGKMT